MPARPEAGYRLPVEMTVASAVRIDRRVGDVALAAAVALAGIVEVECPRLGGHLSAWSAMSGWAGRIVRYAKGIELQEAVPAGVSA